MTSRMLEFNINLKITETLLACYFSESWKADIEIEFQTI